MKIKEARYLNFEYSKNLISQKRRQTKRLINTPFAVSIEFINPYGFNN